MQSAVERWHEILDMRARQMDAAYARLGRTSTDFWDRRARNFHRSTKDSVTGDPFFQRVLSQITHQTTMLDVGAGTGRFALAFASHAKHVTAVEPNASMSRYLLQDAAQQNITNISLVQTTWQDTANDVEADIVICSHVLYPIRDIEPFLTKLLAATRRACYIYLRATHFDALTAPLWKHFHGDERYLPPGYIVALDVLYEMGIYANVEVVAFPHSGSMRYTSLEHATTELLEQLILPNDEQTRSELQALLDGWLVSSDGMLVLPGDMQVCAIIAIKR